MRTGKIARLPYPIRDELNVALRNGIPAVKLIRWLNSHPDVQCVLEQDFGGRPIKPHNMSEWAKGGYREWLLRQEFLEATLSFRQSLPSGENSSEKPGPIFPENPVGQPAFKPDSGHFKPKYECGSHLPQLGSI